MALQPSLVEGGLPRRWWDAITAAGHPLSTRPSPRFGPAPAEGQAKRRGRFGGAAPSGHNLLATSSGAQGRRVFTELQSPISRTVRPSPTIRQEQGRADWRSFIRQKISWRLPACREQGGERCFANIRRRHLDCAATRRPGRLEHRQVLLPLPPRGNDACDKRPGSGAFRVA